MARRPTARRALDSSPGGHRMATSAFVGLQRNANVAFEHQRTQQGFRSPSNSSRALSEDEDEDNDGAQSGAYFSESSPLLSSPSLSLPSGSPRAHNAGEELERHQASPTVGEGDAAMGEARAAEEASNGAANEAERATAAGDGATDDAAASDEAESAPAAAASPAAEQPAVGGGQAGGATPAAHVAPAAAVVDASAPGPAQQPPRAQAQPRQYVARMDAVYAGPTPGSDQWSNLIEKQRKHLKGRELNAVVPSGSAEFKELATAFGNGADHQKLETLRNAYADELMLQHRGTGIVQACLYSLGQKFGWAGEPKPEEIDIESESFLNELRSTFDHHNQQRKVFSNEQIRAPAPAFGALSHTAQLPSDVIVRWVEALRDAVKVKRASLIAAAKKVRERAADMNIKALVADAVRDKLAEMGIDPNDAAVKSGKGKRKRTNHAASTASTADADGARSEGQGHKQKQKWKSKKNKQQPAGGGGDAAVHALVGAQPATGSPAPNTVAATTCYVCGELGHFSYSCPMKATGNGGKGKSKGRGKSNVNTGKGKDRGGGRGRDGQGRGGGRGRGDRGRGGNGNGRGGRGRGGRGRAAKGG